MAVDNPSHPRSHATSAVPKGTLASLNEDQTYRPDWSRIEPLMRARNLPSLARLASLTKEPNRITRATLQRMKNRPQERRKVASYRAIAVPLLGSAERWSELVLADETTQEAERRPGPEDKEAAVAAQSRPTRGSVWNQGQRAVTAVLGSMALLATLVVVWRGTRGGERAAAYVTLRAPSVIWSHLARVSGDSSVRSGQKLLVYLASVDGQNRPLIDTPKPAIK